MNGDSLTTAEKHSIKWLAVVRAFKKLKKPCDCDTCKVVALYIPKEDNK